MTAKRFVDYFDKDHNYIIQDLQNEDEYQVGFVNCDEDVFLELINQLNNENEQLKSSDTITDLETEIMNLKTTIQQLRTDNTKQKKLLNTTMKENEHIKTTIKDMINTERTELGKMTLRHLWRQIQ